MVEVVSVSQMKMIEKRANEMGISYDEMMENAGRAAFENIREKLGFEDRKCAIICGRGNNGGDGLVLARYAAKAGADVTVIFADEYPKTEIAEKNLEIIKSENIPILSYDFNTSAVESKFDDLDIIIDAVYGTGFHGELTKENKKLFNLINNAVAAVVSLDVPSGVNGDTGEADEDCVDADFTITFDSIKPCHIMPHSAKKCGRVDIVDIKIPDEARKALFSRVDILNYDKIKEIIPKRSDFGHKGNFGNVLNIAGSASYTGAAVLSSKSAAVSGAGYVTLMSIPWVCNTVAGYIPEITYARVESDSYGNIKLPKAEDIEYFISKCNVVSIGCGLGKPKDLDLFIKNILENQGNPVIIDADGINCLAENINILKEAKCPVVITPHEGEMARLLKCTAEDVRRDRFNKAVSFAKEYGVTVVLKGHNTIIATPKGDISINTTGNSGLSKAGSGDVLTGLIAGLIAQGVSASEAAFAGVYLHGAAGEMCSKRLSKHCMQPSDIFYDLGEIFKDIENN